MLPGEQLGAFRNNGYDIAPFLAFDLQMYATFGGGVRSRDELGALAMEAGLRVHAVREVHDTLHLLELRPLVAT